MASSIPISGRGRQTKVRKAVQASDPGWVTPAPDIPGAQLDHVCLVGKQQALARSQGVGI